MIAVDTNVLVRYLVEDDPDQADRAEAVLLSGAMLVPTIVLLETVRSMLWSYSVAPHQLGLRTITQRPCGSNASRMKTETNGSLPL